MNLELIQSIVNDSFVPAESKKKLILMAVATAEDAIPSILQIVEAERRQNKELILDLNANLSIALVALTDNYKGENKKFIVETIKKFYNSQDLIGCTMKIDGVK